MRCCLRFAAIGAQGLLVFALEIFEQQQQLAQGLQGICPLLHAHGRKERLGELLAARMPACEALLAEGRELHEHAAAVLRVACALHEALVLQAVDHLRGV